MIRLNFVDNRSKQFAAHRLTLRSIYHQLIVQSTIVLQILAEKLRTQRKKAEHPVFITWLDCVGDVDDGIVAMAGPGRCFVDDDVGEQGFFADDFSWEINSSEKRGENQL